MSCAILIENEFEIEIKKNDPVFGRKRTLSADKCFVASPQSDFVYECRESLLLLPFLLYFAF